MREILQAIAQVSVPVFVLCSMLATGLCLTIGNSILGRMQPQPWQSAAKSPYRARLIAQSQVKDVSGLMRRSWLGRSE